MTLQNNIIDLAGNLAVEDGVRIDFDSMLTAKIPGGPATHPSVTAGTGAPTFSAAQGSLYLNLTGSSASTRLFVNSTGSTTWVAVTTAS